IIGPEFRLTFSMIGYKILDKSYPSNFPGPVVQLLPTVLPPQQTLLKEIVINRIQPIVIKEDTIQYNLDAFNVRQNSLLEEALKLLPNIRVRREGKVIAHGKQINRAWVKSKNIFGGLVLIATRNLTADIVQYIQVIDYYRDEANTTGIKYPEPEK